ncbi:MAG TPA: glycosyltransferase family 4 protein [Kamptonema sp.]|nr:glycosyltransferase family 4 protein [Kamptonema sp.]
MRIAWIGKKSPVCGNVIYCREITNALRKRNHDVTFLHFDTDSEAQTEHTIALPYLYKSGFYTIPSLRAKKVVIDSLKSLKIDLVHASIVLSNLDFCLPAICAQLKLPLIATFHQPFDSQYTSVTALSQELIYQLYGFPLSFYDKIIVFSDLQKMLLKKFVVGEDRIAIVPNSVDADKYSPGHSDIKKEWQAKFIFLYQGRLFPEKNIEMLLQVWSQMSKPEGYKLAIVGTGSLEEKLKACYCWDRSIIWVGYVGDEQRRIEILRGSDVFILPSLVEGLSLALLEAMACGLACIATNAGSHGQVLDEEAGIVMDLKQIKLQLRQVLTAFIEHPELALSLGKRARQRILERYTMTVNIDRLEKLYDRALNKSSRKYTGARFNFWRK